MSILGKFNKFVFEYQYSLFDIAWLAAMGSLVEISWWWFLMVIPCSIISVKMNRTFA